MTPNTLQDINQQLAANGVYDNLFDIVRLVDAQSGKVVEWSGNGAVETDVNCVDVLGSSERCKNCTSLRALYANEQVVKLEFAGGAVLLIISAPVVLDGRHLVAELVKDITASMTVDHKDPNREHEVAGIIDSFNRLAITDVQTGLMNRRFIDERLPNVLLGSKLLGQPVAVAFLDIDHFKAINDTYGHQAGDHILRELGGMLRGHIRREADFAARYGGEEFLLCFPGIPLAICRKLCEEIRTEVQNTPFHYEGATLHVTVSIGVAETGELAEQNQQALVALADKRMYEAKMSGRNRVV